MGKKRGAEIHIQNVNDPIICQKIVNYEGNKDLKCSIFFFHIVKNYVNNTFIMGTGFLFTFFVVVLQC
jgi:hypothetical protein